MFDLAVPDSMANLPGRVHIMSGSWSECPPRKKKMTPHERLAYQSEYYHRNATAIAVQRKIRAVARKANTT